MQIIFLNMLIAFHNAQIIESFQVPQYHLSK